MRLLSNGAWHEGAPLPDLPQRYAVLCGALIFIWRIRRISRFTEPVTDVTVLLPFVTVAQIIKKPNVHAGRNRCNRCNGYISAPAEREEGKSTRPP